MRTNPFSDSVDFLFHSALWWIFVILVVASLAIAFVNLARDEHQRNLKHLSTYGLRFFIGCMWWQQTLWKLPPTYTDLPDGSGGLRYWVSKMVTGAAFSWHSELVQNVVQPHFLLFAPLVYAAEVFIGISLMLGLAMRFGALLGALMAINLWLGLYRTPNEWPWTYFFLIVIQLLFVIYHAGRSLGADALIRDRLRETRASADWRSRLLALIT